MRMPFQMLQKTLSVAFEKKLCLADTAFLHSPDIPGGSCKARWLSEMKDCVVAAAIAVGLCVLPVVRNLLYPMSTPMPSACRTRYTALARASC